jgi:4-hydroxy-3-methylbut-2-enyl diphosphate reductase
MKITIADHFGLCFGVRDAIAQAETLAQNGPLTILGELVHNPVVRERLRARGIVEGSLDDKTARTPHVMITAHGSSDHARNSWSGRVERVADATCPLVRHAHAQLRCLVAAGYFPVVVGKRGHVEVAGLIGDFPEAFVLSCVAEVAALPVRPRYGIISQTTQPIEFVRSIVDLVRRRFARAEVRFVDTVCKPTKDRQSALHRLIEQVELVVVVGGRSSNNTRQLAETCRAAGRAAIHVERAEELEAADFARVERVGITAGTSTLIETVEAVHRRLLTFARQKIDEVDSRRNASARSIAQGQRDPSNDRNPSDTAPC